MHTRAALGSFERRVFFAFEVARRPRFCGAARRWVREVARSNPVALHREKGWEAIFDGALEGKLEGAPK